MYLYYFLIVTVYTVVGHCTKLNASGLRKGFFILHKFAPAVEGLPYLHLTTGSEFELMAASDHVI